MLGRLTEVRAGLADCAGLSLWALSDGSLVEAVEAVAGILASGTGLLAGLVREVDGRGLPKRSGSSSAALWLRKRIRVDAGAAHRLVALARVLAARPALAASVASGVVNPDQAGVIGEQVAALASVEDVTSELVDRFEAALIDRAGRYEPKILRQLSGQILAGVAPEIADRADAAALAREEAQAARDRGLRLTDTRDGKVRVSGILGVEAAAVVNAALDPLCKPTVGDDRNPTQRRADALVEVCQLALGVGELPASGGDRPQIVVTVPYDTVTGRLGAGMLDTGHRLTPEAVRRLACDAGIIPAVLGSAGQVLDLGRTTRLISGSLRRALVLRDRGCVFPMCDRPARWCQGHHRIHWQDGGKTTFESPRIL